MLRSKKYTLFSFFSVLLLIMTACSTKKNTALTRTYHAINTKYNIYYNADIAFQEALKQKEETVNDNLSQLLYIYPDNSDSSSINSGNYSGFTTAIDKTTKAIKLHSIKVRPRRNPSKKNDTNYQAWLKQKEFNPYMKKTWMLLGKSELENGDYLRAATTFLYITKIYSANIEVVTECRLLTARAYTEMGWLFEAGNIIHKIGLEGNLPKKLEGLYASVKANYLIRTGDLDAAIPNLELAIQKEKSSFQKMRMRYLLGQIYAEQKEYQMAYEAFGKVSGLNTPYKYTLNAQLRQFELSPLPQKQKTISQLKKIAKKKKNEQYLDQIYIAIGDSYIQLSDTSNAIENYKLAIERSTRNGFDKAIAQVRLANIYFGQRKYIPAQPAYAEALPLLPKTYDDYQQVALRSEVLDELVVHVQTVIEQDSMQYLAMLPENERLDHINKYIADLKKTEEEAKAKEELTQRKEEREERVQSWNDLDSWGTKDEKTIIATTPQITSQGSSFYFYNEQTIAQGKISFQKQWGLRKLEDDWRRKSKSISSFDDFDMANETDSIKSTIDMANETINENEINTEKYSPEYYLQQLPLTPEKIAESNILIENAFYQMGLIYKVKLGDLNLSIDAFDTDINRFPNTPNKEDIYYQLFLIYMQLNESAKMALYRDKLIAEFPAGKYAEPLSHPDYEWNFRHLAIEQDSLYNATYNAYLAGDIGTVRTNYEAIQSKYPFVELMPKFMLLNALTYAQTKDAKGLTINLKTLVETYPKSDVEPLASEILSRIKDGQILLSDGKPIKGIDWNLAYIGDSTLLDADGKITFSDNLDTEYMLLLRYKQGTIDRNDLLFQVADYNFTNYVVQTFDLDFDTQPPIETMQIKGFKTFANIYSYINKGFEHGGLISQLDTSVVVVPISTENYKKLVVDNELESYMDFFRQNIGYQLPNLMAYWNRNKDKVDYLDELDNLELYTEADDADTISIEKGMPIINNNIENNAAKGIEVKNGDNKQADNKTTINPNELLTDEQVEILNKANDIIEDADDILENPVDGIKNIFKKYKDKKKMSKEEKEALKEEEQIEKERKKREREANKITADSIRAIEKRQEEITKAAEKVRQDSIQYLEKLRDEEQRQIKAAKEAESKAKKEQLKLREKERKEKENAQKERMRQREQDRKEKERQQNEKRKERERLRQEQLKQKEKERKEKEKAEKERNNK